MSIYSLKKLFKESKTPRKFLWCCCSFLILTLLLFFVCRFSSFTFSFRCHPLPFRELSPGFYTHLILSAQLIAERFLTFSYSTIPLSSGREGYGIAWTFFTHRRFSPYVPLRRHLKPAFIKVSLGAGSSSLKFAGLLYWWLSKHTPGSSVCLIHSNPQSSCSERFSFKFYHILSWIACGESLIYLLLTRFELFSLVQSQM